MKLSLILIAALNLSDSLAKYDAEEEFFFVKRVDTGLPDLNEPATLSRIGGREEAAPFVSHSSSSRTASEPASLVTSPLSIPSARNVSAIEYINEMTPSELSLSSITGQKRGEGGN